MTEPKQPWQNARLMLVREVPPKSVDHDLAKRSDQRVGDPMSSVSIFVIAFLASGVAFAHVLIESFHSEICVQMVSASIISVVGAFVAGYMFCKMRGAK